MLPLVTDPYATAASSWPATCTGGSCNTQTVPTNGTYTLQPGVYPSGMTLDGTSCTTGKKGTTCDTSNSVTYTMQPGVYYLGGSLNVPSNSITLNGTGVTIVLTGNNVVNVSGNGATFNLVAPSSGWNQGLAIWEPTSTGTNYFSGGSGGSGNATAMNLTGLIYMPDATMAYNGNYGTQASPDCTEIIANTINLDGSNLNFASGNACSNVAGAPSEIYQPVVLVE